MVQLPPGGHIRCAQPAQSGGIDQVVFQDKEQTLQSTNKNKTSSGSPPTDKQLEAQFLYEVCGQDCDQVRERAAGGGRITGRLDTNGSTYTIPGQPALLNLLPTAFLSW